MPKNAPYEERFFQKVNKTDSCWIWVGAKTSRGYGSIRINGKSIGAHVFSYTHFKGKIPDGMIICHTCDNPSCVNPDHLWTGTYEDNHRDMWLKGRWVQSRGNSNGHNQYTKKEQEKK